MSFPAASLVSDSPSPRQRWLRSRLSYLSLAHAVRRAAGVFFRFKYRDPHAAVLWCENATLLTGVPWQYIKVPQKEFEKLRPDDFEDLIALEPVRLL